MAVAKNPTAQLCVYLLIPRGAFARGAFAMGAPIGAQGAAQGSKAGNGGTHGAAHGGVRANLQLPRLFGNPKPCALKYSGRLLTQLCRPKAHGDTSHPSVGHPPSSLPMMNGTA
jgi:hypothetical protein